MFSRDCVACRFRSASKERSRRRVRPKSVAWGRALEPVEGRVVRATLGEDESEAVERALDALVARRGARPEREKKSREFDVLARYVPGGRDTFRTKIIIKTRTHLSQASSCSRRCA